LTCLPGDATIEIDAGSLSIWLIHGPCGDPIHN
jgi:hypothetical protein